MVYWKNGSEKTTLTDLMGLLDVSEGEIKLNNNIDLSKILLNLQKNWVCTTKYLS